MSLRDRHSSLTFAALLLFAVAVLVVWLFSNGTLGGNGGERPPETSGEIAVGDAADRLRNRIAMTQDESPEAVARREAERELERQRAEAQQEEDDEEAGDYPPTEEYTPPEPIEIALQQEPGSLVGWVNDEQGAPLHDVRVKLQYEESVEDGVEAPTPSAVSTDNGLFTVEEVPPGRWTVVAERPNHATVAQTGVMIASGAQAGPITIRMEPELVLNGTVRAGGEVLAGAEVRVWRDLLTVDTRGDVNRVRVDYGRISTGSDGTFRVNQLPDTTINLQVRAAGFARLDERVSMRADMEALQLTMSPESVVGGVVRGSLSRVIEGATVTLRRPGVGGDAGKVAEIKTGDNGTFLFRELPRGREFDLHAKAENYAPAGPVSASSGSTNNVISLDSGGAILGTVTNFDTGANMASIGVVALAQRQGRRPVALWTKTNSAGRYRIDKLPSGTYTLAIVNERLTSEPATGVQVEDNKPTRGIDFSIYPGLTVTGRVVDGETAEPLENARVNLRSLVGPELLTAKNTTDFTEPSGAFRFENMPQGVYTFEADLEGFMRGAGEESAIRVEALRGTDPEPSEIKLYRGARIEGSVVNMAGSPVSNATVQVFHAGGTPSRIRNQDFSTNTDSGGRFTIEGIPIHQEVHLEVSAWAEGHTKDKSERIILNRDQSSRTVEIVLGAGQDLEVRLVSSTGEGIPNARVTISHPDFSGDSSPPTWRQDESEDGFFIFENVPHGRVRVSASKDGYLPASTNVNVTPQGLAQVEIEMDPAQRITGIVYDDQLVPMRSGRVVARAERGASGSGSSNLDSEGRFSIDTVGEGTFLLEVNTDISTSTGNRRFTWGFPGHAPNMGFADIVLTVPVSGGLEGTIALPDSDGPPARFTINIRGSFTDDAGRGRSINLTHHFSGTDKWSFESLPPGEYNVTASAPNYLPMTVGPFEIESRGAYSAGRITLHPGGALRWRVVNSRTKESVNGVLGRLQPDGPATRTNSQGSAHISPIQPGIYTLELSHGDYLPREYDLVRINRGGENNIGTIEMDPGGVLHGRVTDGNRQPLRGITVEARSVENQEETRRAGTDAGGRYSLRGLRPGGQIVTVSGTVNGRRVARSFDLNVSADRESNHDVVLWANSRLVGTLLAADGVDVSRAVVTLYPMRGDNVPLTSQSIRVRDISGNRFIEEDLVEGRYLVAAQAPRGSGTAYWADTVTVADRDTRVVISQGSIHFEGRLLLASPDGPPAANQEVRLQLLTAPQSGVSALRQWWQWTAQTDEEGFFSLRNLPAGTYSLVAHNNEIQKDILEIIRLQPGQLHYTDQFSFN